MATLLVLAACGGDGDGAGSGGDNSVVRIGVAEGLAGDCSAFGVPPARAVELAAQEINEAGGFEVGDTTYTLDVKVLDDRCDAAAAVSNVIELVEDDGIKYIFGPTTSTFANQAAEITGASEVLHISGAGSWQTLGYLSGEDRPLMFGVQVSLTDTLADLQVAAIEELSGPNATIGILGQDDDVQHANAPPVVEALEERGHTVHDVRFPVDTTDFTSTLTSLKGEGIDVLYFMYPQARTEEVIALGLQLDVAPAGYVARNVDPEVALSGAIGEPLPLPFAVVQGTPSFAYPPNDRVADFTERILEFDPSMPLTAANSAFYTYDVVTMLTMAMQEAGTVDDPVAVGEALRDIVYDGVAGTVCFRDDIRTADYDTGIVFVRDGEVESITRASSCG